MHKHRAADAALDEAGAQYRAAVILACQNVADSLRALQADADALKANVAATQAAKTAFDLARQQRELGTISLVTLLNCRTNLPTGRARPGTGSGQPLIPDTAGLFQALLGGGWWNRSQGGRSL